METNEIKNIQDLAVEVKKDITSLDAKLSATEAKTNADLQTVQQSVDAIAAEQKRASVGAERTETKNHFLAAIEAKGTELKGRRKGQTIEIELDTKAAVNMLSTAANQLRTVTPTMLPYQNIPTSIEDVIATGTISGDTLKYVRELGFEGAPAFTKEGALKPKVSITLQTKTASVTKIAAYFKVSEETTKDYPQFVSYLQARVGDELKLVKGAGMLYGDGVDENLQGIYPLASAFDTTVSKVAKATKIDVLRKGIAQVRKAKYLANAILMNPSDVADMELTKDSNGNYLLPTLYSGVLPAIGRVRIIEQDEMAEGTFLIGAFDKGAQYFTREGMNIRVYDQNEDDAIKNMVTVVVEERGVQAVYRPEAFVKGSFDTVITAITKAA